MEITVVIASNREESLKRWLNAWREDLVGSRVIVVEDNRRKTFPLNMRSDYQHLEHYAWDDIEKALGSDSWVIPRRTSAIKSFGFWQAKDDDAIWTLDDDCYPEEARKGQYLALQEDILESKRTTSPWYNTISHTGLYPRGYPYGTRHGSESQVMVNHGLWSGVPDLDGITALEYSEFRAPCAKGSHKIPRGQAFPMCGMNLAFRREMLPAMYFGLQGHAFKRSQATSDLLPAELPFDRFDDIWAGLFVKKVLDRFNWSVMNGLPSIVHTKESDPTMRVLKEAPGIAAHEELWKLVDRVSLAKCGTVAEAYWELADAVRRASDNDVLKRWAPYWSSLASAMYTWAKLF